MTQIMIILDHLSFQVKLLIFIVILFAMLKNEFIKSFEDFSFFKKVD